MRGICVFFFLISYLIIFSQCSNSTVSRKETLEVDRNYFEIIYNYEDLVVDAKEIIDTLIYLPLETTSESEFYEISQLEITEEYFYILDRTSNSIYIYDIHGNFIKKISSLNEDVKIPFQKILRFTIDPSINKLSFNDVQSSNLYEFDLEGNFVTMAEKRPIDYLKSDYSLLQGHEIALDLFNEIEKTTENHPSVLVSKNNKILFSNLDYDPTVINNSEIIGNKKYFYKSHSDYILFTRPYDYNIYKYDTVNGITKYSQVFFSTEHSLPEDFIDNVNYKSKRIPYIKQNKSIVYKLTDIYETEHFITYRIFTSNFSKFIIFNKKTGEKLDLNQIISDTTTRYLPIFGNYIHGVKNNYFVSSLSPKHVITQITHKMNFANYFKNLPLSTQEIFNKGNNQNNVLVLTKLKNNSQ
ncbi:6-bladed beta-propeller [Sphingobacterium hungaricum]|uniref:6-bladed beta-propeller protein n=1 Tax=Sphingobacterium hungaricum TaxID=2082723 RepID=A0A928V0E6_9SPHI|nr:6-bladed beta-propeller [Sphingobacterium hungaricum]MBE8714800.1 hypothetical protein [Sphingobacterium hungaricum]